MTTTTTTTIVGLASSVFTNLNYFKTIQWTMDRTRDKCINSQNNDNCRSFFLLFNITVKDTKRKAFNKNTTTQKNPKNYSKATMIELGRNKNLKNGKGITQLNTLQYKKKVNDQNLNNLKL